MLGLLFRLLPFWVREPLFIVVGSVFGVRIMFLAVSEEEWAAAGIGMVFLAFTAVRVHTVVRALRARRNPSPAAPGGGAVSDAAVQPQPQAPVGQRPVPAAPQKEPNAWGQAAAAVGVFAALGVAVWLGPHLQSTDDDSTPQAVSCPRGDDEELPSAYRQTPQAVTAEELCKALNRPDLATLLGTPGEIATSASGNSNTALLTDGKVAQPEAEVQFHTYTVNVSATYDKLSIAQYVKVMEFGEETDIKKLSVMGRPAVLSSQHTMSIRINPGSDGSGGSIGQGPLARTLSVAFDGKDRGGYYDITVWGRSGAFPDDSALLDIAEAVLPTIPERAV
ncbi:DUF6215 domain-containing protein [Streptomyces sp. NBC_00102]|uniref:DUF6215 domain-containing protein n=1 Tax=Streptomyces sp. NBC_00102 TaxID=2975652 RepID=UPI002258DEC3|nr:DUF6215 domain-containing protein [Streptomyces sp. NBC_00102]MCX5400681.1 DUF6215 domain-containing protein [Streptomyces sp. NBC_00102]